MNATDVLVLLRIIEQTKHYPKLKGMHDMVMGVLESLDAKAVNFGNPKPESKPKLNPFGGPEPKPQTIQETDDERRA